MQNKRLVIVSDTHCGAKTGLTPPEYQNKNSSFYELQKESWNWYAKTIESLKPIDILVPNGDLIDGSGRRTGGTEQITTDRLEQCNMAVNCLKIVKAKKTIVIRGTRYHTGEESEQFETNVADKLCAELSGHKWIDINGLIFDIKHKIGGSSSPTGRYTAMSRAAIWNWLWAARKQQPWAKIFVRSHRHGFDYCGNRDYLAVVTPGLQGLGSSYGEDECEGTVDFGLIVFDVDQKGGYNFKWLIADVEASKVQALKL